jgi:hypothetical protein
VSRSRVCSSASAAVLPFGSPGGRERFLGMGSSAKCFVEA